MSRRAPAAEPRPAVSVVQVAWMTHVTEGRYVLGIGSGGDPSDAKLRSLKDIPTPCKRTTEALRLMKKVRRSAPFPFDGDFYSLNYSRTTGTRAPFRVASSTSDSTDGPPTHRPNRLRAAMGETRSGVRRRQHLVGATTSARQPLPLGGSLREGGQRGWSHDRLSRLPATNPPSPITDIQCSTVAGGRCCREVHRAHNSSDVAAILEVGARPRSSVTITPFSSSFRGEGTAIEDVPDWTSTEETVRFDRCTRFRADSGAITKYHHYGKEEYPHYG